MIQYTGRVAVLLAVILLAACQPMQQPAPETVLVAGATGRQGSAVVSELQGRGYHVRAMVRDPSGAAALTLAASGMEVVYGDYGKPESLAAAMTGVSKVFFYTSFGPDERQHGENVIAAAVAAGITHLIYSSGAAAEPGRGLADAKTAIEESMIASGVPYTVLRPVAFMENFLGQQRRIRTTGITDSRAPDRMLHFIAIPDIALLVGEAIDNPAAWRNQALNIASDRLTVAEHVAVFSRVLGVDVPFQRVPLEEYLARFPPPLRPLFRWYDEVGYTADVDALRARYPQMQTLEGFLRANWDAGDSR